MLYFWITSWILIYWWYLWTRSFALFLKMSTWKPSSLYWIHSWNQNVSVKKAGRSPQQRSSRPRCDVTESAAPPDRPGEHMLCHAADRLSSPITLYVLPKLFGCFLLKLRHSWLIKSSRDDGTSAGRRWKKPSQSSFLPCFESDVGKWRIFVIFRLRWLALPSDKTGLVPTRPGKRLWQGNYEPVMLLLCSHSVALIEARGN